MGVCLLLGARTAPNTAAAIRIRATTRTVIQASRPPVFGLDTDIQGAAVLYGSCE